MAEFSPKLPIDLNTKSPLQKRLYKGLNEYGDFLGIADSPYIENKNINYLLWSEKVEGLASQLIEPKTFMEFKFMKSSLLHEQIKRFVVWQNDIFNRTRRKGSQFESLYSEEMFWQWVFTTTGVIVEREISEYCDHFENGGFPIMAKESGRLISDGEMFVDFELLQKDIDTIEEQLEALEITGLLPKSKVIANENAAYTIRDYIDNGFRVGIAFGVWDLNHEGHGVLLEEAKQVIGKHGKLIVAVSSDEETSILKGPQRPIQPLSHRINALSRMSVVDGVIPLLPVSTDATFGEIQEYYQKVQVDLSPHFRLLGQREKISEIIETQCKNAGIGVLYSGGERVASTTSTIDEILSKYGKVD